ALGWYSSADGLVCRALHPARHRRYTQGGQRHAGTGANGVGELTGTICLPSGINDTGINLRLASASGIPTIVIAIAAALTKCPIASQTPNSSTQMTFPMRAPVPAVGLSTIVRPNGHNANEAMRSDANPKGMVMMSKKLMSAASR